MRLIFITLVTLIASLYAGEPNQRVTQIMQVLGNSVNNATQTKEAAIAAAEARHQQEVSRANGIAIQGLKRLITSRSTPIEQVEIYRIILSVNREDEDAVRFFTAIGTLDSVLASLDTVTDMFGNEVKKEEALNVNDLAGRWRMAAHNDIWTFAVSSNNNIVLSNRRDRSLDFAIINNTIMFHWNDNDNIIAIELSDGNYIIRCYLKAALNGFDKTSIPSIAPIWESTITRL